MRLLALALPRVASSYDGTPRAAHSVTGRDGGGRGAPASKDLQGVLEYKTDFTQFQAVSSLTLFFPTNLAGDGSTEIWSGELRGRGKFDWFIHLFCPI